MKKILLITFSLVIALASFAQESDIEWKLFPSKADSLMAKDTVKTLDRAAVPGKVSINKDERIDRVSKDLAGGASQRPIVKGYRIQIISSSTKVDVSSLTSGVYLLEFINNKGQKASAKFIKL